MAIRRLAAIAALACLLAAGPADARGQLIVTSRPAGAAVTLDGMAAGTTPAVIDLPSGNYRIGLHGPAHTSASFVAHIVDNLTTRRAIALSGSERRTLRRGELRVLSSPSGASVTVDGTPVGRTPRFVAGLSEGRHHVRVSHTGRASEVRRVTVHAGLTSTLALSLPSQSAPGGPSHASVPARQHAAQPSHAKGHPRHLPAPAMARHARPGAVWHRLRPLAVTPMPVIIAAVPPPTPSNLPGGLGWRWLSAVLGLGFGLALAAIAGLAIGRRRKARPAALGLKDPAVPRGPRAWSGPARPDELAAEAAAAMAMGHWQAAAEALAGALEAGRGSAWHYHHFGLACQRLGRVRESENAYRTAIQLEPGHPDAGYNLAIALADGGDWPRAAIALRRHLDAHPRDASGHAALGQVYHELGMASEADKSWQQALKHSPCERSLTRRLALWRRERPAGTAIATWGAAP